MDKELLHQLLDIQESALSDHQYMQLHKDYVQAELQLRQLLETLRPEQKSVLEQYLLASVPLHHRLIALAIAYGKNLP